MKYLPILLLLILSGCDAVIGVVDESITLPTPIVLEQDKSAPVPLPAPRIEQAAPKQEPAPVVAPKQEPVKAEPKPTPAVKVVVEPKKVVVETQTSRSPNWSYPGSTTDDADRSKLRHHLAGKPHYLSTEGMSAAKVLSLHNDLHEAERNGTRSEVRVETRTAPKAISTVQQFTISTCTICKTDMRDVLPTWRGKGWTILDPIDESTNPRGLYPRYEIRGADGSFRVHVGSLRNWK